MAFLYTYNINYIITILWRILMKILIGADPELFVKKGDKFISAYGMIKGDKKNPQPVRNGAVQVDGMALEFNIDPAATEEDFLFKVEDVMDQLKAMVPEFEVVAVPVAEFGAEYIASQPLKAKELGCDPDFNAWEEAENRPLNAELPFRSASGHVHIGWTDKADIRGGEHIGMVRSLVKQLDFFLALPSVIFDEDQKRRELYGKAGAFRPKTYGLEYRTLSNKWLTSKGLMSLVYRNIHEAVNQLVAGETMYEKYGDIQQIINTSDKKAALSILNKEGIQYEV